MARAARTDLREPILARAWNEEKGAFAGALDGDDLDASVLLLAELGLAEAATIRRFLSTFEAIGRDLKRNGRIMRYTNEDDFGAPETAFLVCNFWYIDALAAIGRIDEARADVRSICSDVATPSACSPRTSIPKTGALWGNIPQTYSMAAIINSATRLSVKWEDAWRRV